MASYSSRFPWSYCRAPPGRSPPDSGPPPPGGCELIGVRAVDDHPPASSPDTDTEPVGAALARLRRDKGLSGRQLGDLVGLSQASVSRIETGATAPDPALIGRLAAALDAPPDVVRSL